MGGPADKSLAGFMVNFVLSEKTEYNISFKDSLHLYLGDDVNAKNSPLRHIRLCHVDALIKFLGLVRAKFMIRNDQNPFEQVMSILMSCRG